MASVISISGRVTFLNYDGDSLNKTYNVTFNLKIPDSLSFNQVSDDGSIKGVIMDHSHVRDDTNIDLCLPKITKEDLGITYDLVNDDDSLDFVFAVF